MPAWLWTFPQRRPWARLETARRLLAEVLAVDEARAIRDVAEAARVYTRQVRLGLEAQNDAAEMKLRAERRLGELLATMDKHRGGNVHRSQAATGSGDDPLLLRLTMTGVFQRVTCGSSTGSASNVRHRRAETRLGETSQLKNAARQKPKKDPERSCERPGHLAGGTE